MLTKNTYRWYVSFAVEYILFVLISEQLPTPHLNMPMVAEGRYWSASVFWIMIFASQQLPTVKSTMHMRVNTQNNNFDFNSTVTAVVSLANGRVYILYDGLLEIVSLTLTCKKNIIQHPANSTCSGKRF